MKLARQQFFANQNEVRYLKQNLTDTNQNKAPSLKSEVRARKQKRNKSVVSKLKIFRIGRKSEHKSNSARQSVLSMAQSISLMSLYNDSEEWDCSPYEDDEESKSIGGRLQSIKKRFGNIKIGGLYNNLSDKSKIKRSARSLQKKPAGRGLS